MEKGKLNDTKGTPKPSVLSETLKDMDEYDMGKLSQAGK